MKADLVMGKLCRNFLCLFVILIVPNISHGDIKNSSSGFIDINVYPYLSDVDEDNTISINVAAKLPGRFSYFSLNNIGNVNSDNERVDTTTFYTEQNLRWTIADGSPLDLTIQLNFLTGVDNDRHRLGVRWRLNDTGALRGFFKSINLSYSVNLHAIQFDKDDADVWQIEHVFRLLFPYISTRLYLAGFIDHSFNQSLPDDFPSNPIVGEIQLGYRLVENLYVISEYRVNQYRRYDVNNLAIGIQYKAIW